ncbi:MAG: NTP transferase domain-containing protein [Candidatus Scalinduaceae bacterium]
MKLIVLAAGQGFKLDGFNKLLIKDPRTGERILDRYLRLFADYEVIVVVGFRAIEIMSEYPNLNYIYNDQWRITGNSYSLSLALDETPCVVISADLLFDEDTVKLIDESPENSVFVLHSENKGINTLRCKVKKNIVKSIYMGEEPNNDYETTGIYKITYSKILRKWKNDCSVNRNVFAGSNIPVDIDKLYAVDISSFFFHEINTPLDYLNLKAKIEEIK